MNRTINAIVGKSDQNISSALDSIPDVHVRFATNNENEYLLINDNDNNIKNKKNFRRKSNLTNEFDRQTSTIHRKIDQYQVKENLFFLLEVFLLMNFRQLGMEI